METNNRDDILREVPMGFGFALIKNEAAMRRYSEMSESEKEEILMKCKDAKSKKEMQKIVDELVPDKNINSLYEGPKTM
ncbi:MAG: hypothetical protein IKK33_04995 [Lachnospiraceae bacterium]|nr:hypothetical protein [Lachnospiraceae bacterium]